MNPQAVPEVLTGAALALMGAALVEALVWAGLRPMGPVGWPVVGMVAAAAFCGVYGFVGGGLVTLLYFGANALYPGRFPEFFASPSNSVAWMIGLTLAGAAVITLRARFLETAVAAAAAAATLREQRALRASEERFRTLTELSADYYWEQDEQFRFTARTSNPGEKRPYPIDQVIGRTRWELPALNLAPQDWARHRAELEAHREFRNFVVLRPTPGGEPRYISTSGRPMYDDAGTFRGYCGVGRDITEEIAQLEAIGRSEGWLRAVADNVPGLVAYVDAQERYLFNNRAYGKWFAIPADEVTGKTIREVWGESRYAMLRPNIARVLAGERVTVEYAMPEGGVDRHILSSYVPDTDANGAVKGFFVQSADVTQLAAAREELQVARERLEKALDGTSTALWDLDLRSGRVFLSEAWGGILGEAKGEVTCDLEALLALVHPEDLDEARRAFREAVKGERPVYAAEHRVRAGTGEWRWILSRGRVTERDPATGRASRMIGTNLDITERKRMEQALQSVARTDPLTGLANRMALMDRAGLALARSRRHAGVYALLYLDVDRFKEINDSLGHAAGDALLKALAARLRGCVRQTDTVARLGGDEFVILLEQMAEAGVAQRIAEKVLQAAGAPLQLDSGARSITTSVGIALLGADPDVASWLGRADAALYEAKNAGRNAWRLAR